MKPQGNQGTEPVFDLGCRDLERDWVHKSTMSSMLKLTKLVPRSIGNSISMYQGQMTCSRQPRCLLALETSSQASIRSGDEQVKLWQR